MEKVNFTTTINAPKAKVWQVLWDDVTYKQWTKVFHEGSYAVSDWKEGSEIHFLTPEGSGMYSIIEKNIPQERMSFKHIGEIKNFEELPLDDASSEWSGATENYMLEEDGDKTILNVAFDSVEDHLEFFNDVFPKALEIIKELSEDSTKTMITIEATVASSIDKIWGYWTKPEHIMNWCSASEDWHVPAAENDLRVGGRFNTKMAAKDGSFAFDFGGVYTDVKTLEYIAYKMDDGRNVTISFKPEGNGIKIIESFDPETSNSMAMQEAGWQAILDNFKKYTEGKIVLSEQNVNS